MKCEITQNDIYNPTKTKIVPGLRNIPRTKMMALRHTLQLVATITPKN